MKFSIIFRFILFLAVLSFSFRIVMAMHADELLVDDFRQASGAAHKKHAIKSECSFVGCCSGGCKRDQRYEVNPDRKPYRVHAFITAYFPSEGWLRGTATVISDSCLITAAHCLYHKGEKAREVVLSFGMRQIDEFSCCCFSCKTRIKQTTTAIISRPVFAIHPSFLQDPLNSPYDVAVITLKTPSLADIQAAGLNSSLYGSWDDIRDSVKIQSLRGNFAYGDPRGFLIGKLYGTAGLSSIPPEDLVNEKVYIAGYPARAGRRCGEVFNMFCMVGTVEETTPESCVLYKIDATDGQSGAGLCLLTEDDRIEIAGVHTGEYNRFYNHAIGFDGAVRQFLLQCLNAFDHDWASTNLATPADA